MSLICKSEERGNKTIYLRASIQSLLCFFNPQCCSPFVTVLCDVVAQVTQNIFFSLLYFQFYKHVVQSVEKFIQKVS